MALRLTILNVYGNRETKKGKKNWNIFSPTPMHKDNCRAKRKKRKIETL